MKIIILFSSIVLLAVTNASSQDIRPSGFWLEILFPEVKEYMDEMEDKVNEMDTKIDEMNAKVNQLETKLTELRESYIRYQHFQNVSIGFQSLAATNFGIAGIWFDSTTPEKFEDYWDLGFACINLSTEALNKASEYGDKLDIYDNINSSLQFNLSNLNKSGVTPEKE
jgi:hypothetical protein